MSVEILNKTSVVVNFATFLRDGKELKKQMETGDKYSQHANKKKTPATQARNIIAKQQ